MTEMILLFNNKLIIMISKTSLITNDNVYNSATLDESRQGKSSAGKSSSTKMSVRGAGPMIKLMMMIG